MLIGSRPLALSVGCLAALVFAGPASAAWTAPQDVPATTGRYPLFAAYGPGGDRYVGVFGPLALIPSTPQVPVSLSRAPAAGPFGAPARLPDPLGTPVAISPGGTVLAVGGPRSPLDYFSIERRRSRLRARIGRLGGPMASVATRGLVGTRTLAAAVNDRGDAAVVFSRCVDTRCATRSVLAAFRRHGRGFSAPIVLARRTGFPAGAVAVNARGDALVVWQQRRDVRVRLRRAGGGLTASRIAGTAKPVPTISVTLTDARRGVVSWFSEGVSEGSVGGPLSVSAAAVSPRGTISSHRLLDTGAPAGDSDNAVQGLRLRALLGRDGVTTVAWTGYRGGHYIVRAQRLRPGARPQTLSPAGVDAQLMDLAGDGAGDTIAAWVPAVGSRTPAEQPGVGVAIRGAAEAAFGAPELPLVGRDVAGTAAAAIAPGGRAIVAGGPGVALNPTDAPPVRVVERAG